MAQAFKVGLTRDCIGQTGELVFDRSALGLFDNAPGLTYEIIAEDTPEITPDLAARYDAIVVLTPRVTARTLSDPSRRVRLIARFGVGYDNIDTAACTDAGVMLTITPDGVRRPVATVILTFILALAQKLFLKDTLTKTGRWAERTRFMGEGLTGKTVGSIGFGNIGRELFRLLAPLDMTHIACDPVFDDATAAQLRVRRVDMDTLLREADFVCVNCPLNAETRGLIGARELGLMRPGAYFINTARGPIVDEAALCAALAERRIAGAAIDVFAVEPTPADNPILKLDNIITTPHALCWTDECFRAMAEDAFRAVLAVADGTLPVHIVNRDVLRHAAWRGRAPA